MTGNTPLFFPSGKVDRASREEKREAMQRTRPLHPYARRDAGPARAFWARTERRVKEIPVKAQ